MKEKKRNPPSTIHRQVNKMYLIVNGKKSYPLTCVRLLCFHFSEPLTVMPCSAARSQRCHAGSHDGGPDVLADVSLQQLSDHLHHRHLEALPGRGHRNWNACCGQVCTIICHFNSLSVFVDCLLLFVVATATAYVMSDIKNITVPLQYLILLSVAECLYMTGTRVACFFRLIFWKYLFPLILF